MGRGGARNRSGPAPDPASGRSDRRGYRLDALPADGYTGEAPAFPLPEAEIVRVSKQDGETVREVDDEATRQRNERELELWAWAWSTPQACAWSTSPWRWHAVAMWVRTSALCEAADATAADKNSLHRFADQIGLTPAGLKENGWKIAADEVAEKRGAPAAPAGPPADDPRGRLTVVRNAAG